jgi:hypothetical protein
MDAPHTRLDEPTVREPERTCFRRRRPDMAGLLMRRGRSRMYGIQDDEEREQTDD